jgi:hypothetical protein
MNTPNLIGTLQTPSNEIPLRLRPSARVRKPLLPLKVFYEWARASDKSRFLSSYFEESLLEVIPPFPV